MSSTAWDSLNAVHTLTVEGDAALDCTASYKKYLEKALRFTMALCPFVFNLHWHRAC